jgi:hypothetical protein
MAWGFLAHRLGAVALVAASPVVVEVEAKVWTLLYWCVMVAVEVSLATVPLLSQFI